jgi:hypothetical protein
VPGHEDTVGNKTTYQLAKLGSECPFVRPEPTWGVLVGVVKKAVREWTKRDHKKHWESLTGLKQTKGLIQGTSARRTKELLSLNRDPLLWVVGLLTGHVHLKGHLFKTGLIGSPLCESCLEEDETATHINVSGRP